LNVERFVEDCESELSERYKTIDRISDSRLKGILKAFSKVGLTHSDLIGSTGYGLGDIARDKLEKVFSILFDGEGALVRPQMASGTHALTCVLFGLLRPGDRVVSITGTPYDTLLEVIGIRPSKGSLAEFQITYAQTDWRNNFKDFNLLELPTKLVLIQRSPGYQPMNPITIEQLEGWIKKIKSISNKLTVMVDNCYCEFASEFEPGQVGADLTIGSLIKNPGGGLCHTGGYIVGRKNLIDLVATRVTAPGIGGEIGATWGFMMDAFRGLFLAAAATASALKGALLWSQTFSKLGFDVKPELNDSQVDTVVSIKLDSRELFLAFGKSIQSLSPLDSNATPEPYMQGGYEVPVMLAGGGFTAGGTADLSCDGLDKPPFWVYVQGGVNVHHVRLGICSVLEKFVRMGVCHV